MKKKIVIKTKNLIKRWCPPVIIEYGVNRLYPKAVSFSGNYDSWESAKRISTGYEAEEILKKVYGATLKVKRGEAIFERDSVCFYEEEYRWQTLSCLLSIAASNGGYLHVLDWGGALGSFYFQHKKFLSTLKGLKWAVVEQENFVTLGQSQIQDEVLRFYYSLDTCVSQQKIDVVFFSSVLQYIETPFNILSSISELKVPYILIDRTPFISGSRDRIAIQEVSKDIYNASYPAWFFSEEKLIKLIDSFGYKLIVTYPGEDKLVNFADYKGMLFEKI